MFTEVSDQWGAAEVVVIFIGEVGEKILYECTRVWNSSRYCIVCSRVYDIVIEDNFSDEDREDLLLLTLFEHRRIEESRAVDPLEIVS